jgi:hypothetical protein
LDGPKDDVEYDGDPTGGTGDYSAKASDSEPRVRLDIGGWISGPCLSEPYGINVGRFIEDHPDWVIMAGFEGVGYSARRRDDRGRGAGISESALTLDELAARLAAQEEQA